MKAHQKLGLVLWKNWILRKRHYIVTGIEIILPTLLSIILVAMNSEVNSVHTMSEFYMRNYTIFQKDSFFQYSDEYSQRTLYYSPNKRVTRKLMESVEKKVNQALNNSNDEGSFKVIAVENEADFVEIYKSSNETFMGGVAFTSDFNEEEKVPKHLEYRLRLNSDSFNRFQTDQLKKRFIINRPYGSSDYLYTVFPDLQHYIATSYIEALMTNSSLPNIQVVFEMFPYPEYEDNYGLMLMLEILISLFLMLSFLLTIPTLTKNIVHEKERGINELMQIMGLSSWIQWLGWFISNFTIMIISTLIIVILLCSPIAATHAFFPHSAPELLFLLLLLYVAASILFAFFISTLFNKPTVVTAVAVLLWLVSYAVPYSTMNVHYYKWSLSAKLAVSLFPNTCMAWLFKLITKFESKGIGLRWSELSSVAFRNDDLTPNHLIAMMFACIFIYGFLTWYIDNVFPGIYGVPKPWYFFLTKGYWCKPSVVHVDIESLITNSSNSFEEEPTGLYKGIIIKNLTKNYGWFQTGKLAVDNISLNLFENQITALLGHNGAGKTTTMSVLTGMYPPTKGTAFISNLDIRTQIDRAREEVGLCPQHNMLFNELTAQEHLEFFAKLKGLRGKELKQEVDKYLNKVQLWVKKDTLAMNLSGGMQRKLHLGMALIGNSKIVMLDEPTSGLDPEARRTIWDLLQEMRVGRTILLTTHFMEEADVLGDRIAIMSHGRIKCCGTPMFLKQKYGAGYHLNLSKGEHYNKDATWQLISKFVPTAYVHSDVSAELSFILPTDQTSSFPDLFTELEKNLTNLGISGFGVSVTTMEEVFLKVGEMGEKEEGTKAQSSERLEISDRENIIEQNSRNISSALVWQQFYGLFLKRISYNRRRWLLMIFQIFVPVTMAISVLTLINAVLYSSTYPPLKMDLSPYGKTTVFYKANQTLAESYVQSLPQRTESILAKDLEKDILDLGRKNLRKYSDDSVIAAEILLLPNNNISANVMYNGLFSHSLPASLNQLHNALLRYYTNVGDASITPINAPFPAKRGDLHYEGSEDFLLKGFLVGMFLSFGLSFITSSFVVLPIHERRSKSKHLQMMTGVGGSVYWGTTFLWDFILYFITILALVLIFSLLDSGQIFTTRGGLGALFVLLLLYGFSSLPFSYMMSFIFKLPASGFAALTIINILVGVICSLIIYLFETTMDLARTAYILKWFFDLFPSFTVTIGLMYLPNSGNMFKLRERYNETWSHFDWRRPGIGQVLTMMVFDCLFYFFLLWLIESGLLYNVWYNHCPRRNKKQNIQVMEMDNDIVDSDVSAEQQRIDAWKVNKDSNTGDSDALVIHNLTKKFFNLVAVDNLNIGVKNGECFGLLGVNGAGKTTTFRMLTGDELITDGNVYFPGTSLKDRRAEFLKHISYCPQFDALIDHLTGREILYLFARLRGVKEKNIPSTVNDMISFVGIKEYADKITIEYSGGNKRKLSAAIALIGEPPMIFLDEPTTGVDPLSRRKIWDILTSVKESGTSLILTSHSMEECEALCSRIAIMVNGKFKCLGAVQHLKNKYGQGFTVIAKIDSKSVEDVSGVQQSLEQYIEKNFNLCVLKDSHQGMVQYHVADTTTTWAHLFQVMEQAKQMFHLEDYSVSQTTLEQVFLSFARKQRQDPLQKDK